MDRFKDMRHGSIMVLNKLYCSSFNTNCKTLIKICTFSRFAHQPKISYTLYHLPSNPKILSRN